MPDPKDPVSPQKPAAPTAAAAAPAKTADEVLQKGEKTVTMIFPEPVMILLPNGQRVAFEAGPQEVPESLVDHHYLKDSGVTRYKPKAAVKK